MTIRETASGIPWAKSHFNNHWRSTILAAGLDGLHFHDIRGTTCTALTEALSDSAVAKLELRA